MSSTEEANKRLRKLIRDSSTTIEEFRTALDAALEKRRNSMTFIAKRNANGLDLLASAVLHHRSDILDALLSHFSCDTAPLPLAYLAAQVGFEDSITVLSSHFINPNRLNTDGHTALWLAVKHRSVNLVSALLAAGASPLAGKQTAIDKAIARNERELLNIMLTESLPCYRAELLVRFGAKGNLKMMKVILQTKDCVNIRDKNGHTPLFNLAHGNARAAAQLLLDHGADPNVTTHSGMTPLHVAVRIGALGMATALIKNGANINAACSSGLRPIHMAASSGKTKGVVLLNQHKANLVAKTPDGMMATDFAIEAGHQKLAEFIVHCIIKRCKHAKDNMYGESMPYMCATSPGYKGALSVASPPSAPVISEVAEVDQEGDREAIEA
ncbi:Ankyrin repeats (3 copies) [Carpediemonas membranifera]|uniref:Ankyrin repeats (3 copies) n=1 Tax=Carpediemonas membranifera TaxID=201153 RepID=A0A8J6BUY3_9EUKA|nr:Ankyrin repeats (3 copies) [Carpediemonas membranifera]|eukprot:KAG9390846.1 Ankyrin repeats (3 copies) [Carpediemonas membranifera]